jgi:hypothetical protein
MVEVSRTKEDVLRMLEAMQLPATPSEAFTAKYPAVIACRRWHMEHDRALSPLLGAAVARRLS